MPSNFTSLVAVLTLGLLGLADFCSAYQIHVKNNCRYTIWPGLAEFNFAGAGNFVKATKYNRGAKLNAGQMWTANVPDGWVGGRIWARTGCNADATKCARGTCPGGLYCTDYNWTESLSLAEFGWGAATRNSGPRIWYNLSVMQGFNVPVSVVEQPSGRRKACNSINPPKGQAWIPSDGPSSSSVNNCEPRGTSFTVTFC